jgi:hypothetical protein
VEMTLFADTADTLESLILENMELREMVADLVLQTAILRERLNEAKSSELRLDGVEYSVH